MPERDDRRGTAAAAAWCGVGALACFAMGRLEPNLLEEGLLLHVGERLLAGEHLYRDIELVTGPVPYAFVGGIFRLFGPDMLAARAGVAMLQGLACGAVYAMGRRSGAGPWAHAAAAALASAPVLLFPLLSTAFYTTISTSLSFVAAWLALRAVGSTRWGLAAGVAIALTALSKQTVGALLAATLVPAIALCAPLGRRLSHAAAVCAGGAVTAVGTLALFAALGDLEVFVSSLLATPSGDVFGSPFINLWPPARLSAELAPLEDYYVPELIFILRGGKPNHPPSAILLSQLLFVLPFAVLAVAALRRAAGPLPAGLWIFACATLACASNLFPRADAGHLVFAAPAALAFAFCLLPFCAPRSLARRRAASLVGAGAVVALLLLTSVWVGQRLYTLAGAPTWGPRVPVRPVSPPKRWGAVPRVIHYLRARLQPGEPIFVARTEPLLYFATGARNPTPFTGALQVWGIRGVQQDRILEALEELRFVVMSDVDEPINTSYRDELPRVQEALERHFAVPPVFTGRKREEDWILVLERAGDRGATLVDLRDPALSPHTWVRQADGSLADARSLRLDLPTRHNRRPVDLALGPLGGGVDWEIEVPEAARFQVSVGFRKLHLSRQPDGVRFLLKVGRGGVFTTLASRRVSFDLQNGSGRRWSELVAELDGFAGQRVTLRVEAVPRGAPQPGRVAIFGSPRLAGPAGAP